MKAYFACRKGLKYFKYTDTPWTQTTPNDNNDNFVVSASSEYWWEENMAEGDSNWVERFWRYAKHAFDNNASTYWRANATVPQWLQMQFSELMKITKFTYYRESQYMPTAGDVQGSNNGTAWTTITTWTNSVTTGNVFEISLPNNTSYYKYYRINITAVRGNSLAGCIQLNITGIRRTVGAGTPASYDYTEDVILQYTPTRKIRKYYKKIDVPWIQPALTSTTSYGYTTTSHSATGHESWRALDGNVATWWEAYNTKSATWKWALPNSIKVKGISIIGKGAMQGRLYTDSTKTTPIGDAFTLIGDTAVTIPGIPIAGIITQNIFLDQTGGSDQWNGIYEMNINAAQTEQVEVETSQADSQYYRDYIIPYTVARK